MKKSLLLVWSLLMAVAMQAQLNGLFSVSSTKQVQFSKGNLVYNCSSQSFSFASTQYAVIGTANSTNITSKTGSIDLFGWGTSGYNNCMPYETSLSVVYGGGGSSIAGTQYDWGVKNFSGYRTLTNSEWNYLLSSRTNALALKAPATVNGVCGWILLPDNWSKPSSITFTSYDDGARSYSSNSYSTSQFSTMENAGAVFLPAAGWRYSSGSASVVSYVNSQGYYWTASSGAAVNFLGNYCVSGQDAANYSGCAVRLVKDGGGGGGSTQYTITTDVSPAGTGTVTGGGTYSSSQTVTLYATPASGYEFDYFYRSYDGQQYYGSTWRFTPTQSCTVTAYFKPAKYTIYAHVAASSGKKGTVSPEQASGYNGDVVKFTATPAKGCVFQKWDDGSTNPVYTYTIQGTVKHIYAYFESTASYKVTAKSGQPSMGSVSGGGTYPAGEKVTLTATPNKGYKVTGWDGQARFDNSATRVIYLFGDSTCTAYFAAAQKVTITATAEPAEAATVTGGGQYYEQEQVTLSYKMNAGYKFKGWQKYNESTGKWVSATSTFTATTDATYRALFEEAKTFTVTVSQPEKEKGYITLTPQQDFYYEGDTIYLQAFPTDCYKFMNWKRNDQSSWSQTANPLRIIVKENYQLRGQFDKNPYKVLVTGGGYGSIRVIGPSGRGKNLDTGYGIAANDTSFYKRVEYKDCPNTELTVEAMPTMDGYFFYQWSDGSTENPHKVILSEKDFTLSASFNKLTYVYNCGSPNIQDMQFYSDRYKNYYLRGKGYMKEYVYDPQTKTTTASWKNSFKEENGPYTLIVEDSVKSISNYAFYNMKGLEKLIIESSVFDSIGQNAFLGSGVREIIFNDKLRSIGDRAFEDCDLYKVVFTNPVPATIGKNTWDYVTAWNAYVPAGSKQAYSDAYRAFQYFYEWYKVNIEVVGDGICTVDKHLYPIEGDTVSLHVRAGEGLVARIQVTDEFGNYIELDENYRFAMPASHVTVKATFGPKYEFDNLQVSVFRNVATLSWYVSPQPSFIKIAVYSENEEIYSESLRGTASLTSVNFNKNGTYHWFLTALDANTQPLSDPAEGPVIVISQMQGLEDIPVPETDAPRKILQDGAIYILRGEKVYTITGQEVR